MNSSVDGTGADGPPASPAGTVVLLREAAEPECLLLRRPESMRVLGGFWVFPGGAVDACDGGGAVQAAAAAACRELLEEAGLGIDSASLVHWARWITPTALRRRFDTHFFVAMAPPGQDVVISAAEASEARWVPLGRHATGERSADFPITPPTAIVLREIAEAVASHGALDGLLGWARSRTVRTVLPKLTEGGIVVFPWDPLYVALTGGGVPWDEEAIAERAGWPTRLPVATQ